MDSTALQIALAHAHRCYQAGDLPQAAAAFERILADDPNQSVALGFLALIAHRSGDQTAAVELNQRAISANPLVPAFHANLASALNASGRVNEAAAAARAALALKPDFASALINLGNALLAQRDLPAATAAYQAAIRAEPTNLEANHNLGNALRMQGQLDQAIIVLRNAIALNGNVAELHATLANALKDQGRPSEAIESFRKAVALVPRDARFGSSLLYALWFDPNLSERQILAEHRTWAAAHADALLDPRPFANPRDPDRRLRIGYLSSDFRDQVIGLYLEPLLSQHDHTSFEIFGYSDVVIPDTVTDRLRGRTDHWRSIVGMDDGKVAELIRSDGIDILIELGNHLNANRLLALARKPAPVQMSYLAHPAPTGMKAIDHLITDPYLHPPTESADSQSAELLRLPTTYLTYPAPANAPIHPPPCLNDGFITFISVNQFSKVNDSVLRIWSEILAATPRSRLLIRLDGAAAGNPSALRRLTECGIDVARVELIDALPRDQYLASFARADIALDPFPYAGYTTTLDTLWMGVPLVTLAGQAGVGRAGVSILSNIGMQELIANDRQRYVQIASQLAGDPARLSDLRSTLRSRIQNSPLVDAKQFTRDMEALYRDAWRRWCSDHHAH